jgi:hypothetical protein
MNDWIRPFACVSIVACCVCPVDAAAKKGTPTFSVTVVDENSGNSWPLPNIVSLKIHQDATRAGTLSLVGSTDCLADLPLLQNDGAAIGAINALLGPGRGNVHIQVQFNSLPSTLTIAPPGDPSGPLLDMPVLNANPLAFGLTFPGDGDPDDQFDIPHENIEVLITDCIVDPQPPAGSPTL